mgnify:CR=1 FL=1
MSKITDLLKEVSKDVLTEESLEQIETVFTEAVDTKADERAQRPPNHKHRGTCECKNLRGW